MDLDYAKPETPNDSRRARRIIAIILFVALILMVVPYTVAVILAIREMKR